MMLILLDLLTSIYSKQQWNMLKTLLQNLKTACSRRKTCDCSSFLKTDLRKCLTTYDLTLIGIGSTLGSGIYVITGEVAKNKAGPAIILSFLLAAFASILSGLCYAEFSARIPKAGSAYVYCYIAVGEFPAFVVGWTMILEYIIGASAVARGLVAYTDSLSGGMIKHAIQSFTGVISVPGVSSYIDFCSFGLVIFFTVLLSFGMKNSAHFNNLCVIINISTVTTVVLVGVCFAKPSNWSNFMPFGLEGILTGASTCFFAFIGFDIIANVSEEAKNPAKSIPLSMIGTISACFVAYFCVSGTITLMVNYTELDEDAAVAVAFNQRGLRFMGYIVGAGATCGLLGTTLVSIIPVPRMMYAMSQDGLLFPCFSTVNRKTQVPVVSTVISGVFIGLLAAIIDLNELVEMLSIGTLLSYSIVVICVLLLRYRASSNDQVEHEPLLAEDTQSKKSAKSFVLKQSTVIDVLVFFIAVQIIILCLLMSYIELNTTPKNITICVLVASVFILLLLTVIYLSRQTTRDEELSFRVPLVPWLPVLALFFNAYLMLKLSKLTWIRFLAWLVLGIVMYFSYSIRHSVEGQGVTEQHSMEKRNE